ncbi:MAG: hypothetical protein ACRDIV_27295 [Ktedonobacteraceae bacterium]
MMTVIGDTLTQAGQIAAIILLIYLFVNILIGLVFAVVFMFAFAWVGDKAELIKKLRPTVKSVNEALKNPEAAVGESANGLVKAVHSIQSIAIPEKIESVQRGVQSVEQKVDQGADRVASAVIEFRARTAQTQGVLKAFFLPGLTRKSPYRHVLPEVAMGVSEQSLRESADTPELPAAPAPLELAGPDMTDGAKRERVAARTKGDGSTGDASRA